MCIYRINIYQCGCTDGPVFVRQCQQAENAGLATTSRCQVPSRNETATLPRIRRPYCCSAHCCRVKVVQQMQGEFNQTFINYMDAFRILNPPTVEDELPFDECCARVQHLPTCAAGRGTDARSDILKARKRNEEVAAFSNIARAVVPNAALRVTNEHLGSGSGNHAASSTAATQSGPSIASSAYPPPSGRGQGSNGRGQAARGRGNGRGRGQ